MGNLIVLDCVISTTLREKYGRLGHAMLRIESHCIFVVCEVIVADDHVVGQAVTETTATFRLCCHFVRYQARLARLCIDGSLHLRQWDQATLRITRCI